MSEIEKIEREMRSAEGALRQNKQNRLAQVAVRNKLLMKDLIGIPLDEDGQRLLKECEDDHAESHGFIAKIAYIEHNGSIVYQDPLKFDAKRLKELEDRVSARRIFIKQWLSESNLKKREATQKRLNEELEVIEKKHRRRKSSSPEIVIEEDAQ